jgi:hypothetical protein
VSLQLAPDANGVFVAFGDGWLMTFDLNTFEVMQELRHKTQLVAAAVTPDGRRIVSAGQDRSAFVWDKETGIPIARHIGGGDFGAVATSDRMIAVGDRAGDVLILELMGVDPGPRLVPLLKDGDRPFFICPYCASQSSVMAQAGDEVVCATCHQTLSIVQVPPCKALGLAAAAAADTELRDFIRSPLPQAPPPRSKRQGWLRRLLPWAFRTDSAVDR